MYVLYRLFNIIWSKDVIVLTIFKYYKSKNSVPCSILKKNEQGRGEAYMISVAEQSAIKILGIKKNDMSEECSKYNT